MDEDYPATTRSGYLTRNFAPYIPSVPSGSYQNPEEDTGFFRGLWESFKEGVSVGWTPPEREQEVYDSWNRQIQEELELPQTQKEIAAEADFQPLQTMGLAEGASNMALTGAIDSIGDFFRGTEDSSEKLETAGNLFDLYGERVANRADAVGRGRTFAELMSPTASVATAMVPLGAGYRLTPQAFRATKLGQFMRPATGTFGKGVEFAANRLAPAAYIGMAGSRELPGQFAQNTADEVAGYGGFVATYGLGNVIKNALGPRGRLASRALTGGSILGGLGAGLGSAVVAGNAVDRQRMQTGRNWAFQDQERLDWAYENNPEWFPEFNK